MNLIIPENYKPKLDIKTTEIAVNQIKDCFEKTFVKVLDLKKVSSPLFLPYEENINKIFDEKEQPVVFNTEAIDENTNIIYSLRKWKRYALKKYEFMYDEGMYTTLNSINQNETTDNLHSIFIDQWGWEKIILMGERNLNTLKNSASQIFRVLKIVESYINDVYPILTRFLPSEVKFITTSKIKEMYPSLTPVEREEKITKEYKAVFLMQIGDTFEDGEKHEEIVPDYDDWSLNGKLIVWFPILNCPVKILSLGIRVDEKSLLYQLKKSECLERADFPFQKAVLNRELPYTIGSEISQSRLCMLLLGKAHIGEVQPSVWPYDVKEKCNASNIRLL